MKRRRYVIGILLCVTALLQAQDSVKSFDEFFVAGMDKINGVFPVYGKMVNSSCRRICNLRALQFVATLSFAKDAP